VPSFKRLPLLSALRWLFVNNTVYKQHNVTLSVHINELLPTDGVPNDLVHLDDSSVSGTSNSTESGTDQVENS